MRDRSIRIVCCALLASTALASPAKAQIEPQYRNWDENGVDLVQGDFELSFLDGSIGSGPAELALLRFGAGTLSSQWDRISFRQFLAGGVTTTKIGMPDGSFEIFQNGVNTKANGSTLNSSGEFVAWDGTRITFVNPAGDVQPSNFCGTGGGFPCDLLPETITYPDSSTITFEYNWAGSNVLPPNYKTYVWRLKSVANSFGYKINFTYQAPLFVYPPPAGWNIRTTAQFQRDAITQATVSYAYSGGSIAPPASSMTRTAE